MSNGDNGKATNIRKIIDTIRGEGHLPPLSPSNVGIIIFYSDRNLNRKMEFRNKKVEQYYHKNNNITEAELNAIKQEKTKAFQQILSQKNGKIKENIKEVGNE